MSQLRNHSLSKLGANDSQPSILNPIYSNQSPNKSIFSPSPQPVKDIQKRLHVVDFEDCFHMNKAKDFMQVNRARIQQISKDNHLIKMHYYQQMALLKQQKQTSLEQISADLVGSHNLSNQDLQSPLDVIDRKKQFTNTSHYPLKESPMEKEKIKLQGHLNKIKQIILGNPYKYVNYHEDNQYLVPAKLINLKYPNTQREDGVAGFSDHASSLFVDDEKNLLKDHEMVHQYKLNKKIIDKQDAGIKNKIIFHPVNNTSIQFKQKLELIKDDAKFFNTEGGTSPQDTFLNSESPPYTLKVPILSPSQKKAQHQRSHTINDPSIKSNLMPPLLSNQSRFKGSDSIMHGQENIEPYSHIPDTIKLYLQNKKNVEQLPFRHQINHLGQVSTTQMKKQYQQQQARSRTLLVDKYNQLPNGSGLIEQNINHSGNLLKHAKEIINIAAKSNHANLGLIKFSDDLKSQVFKENPQTVIMQGHLFENYDEYKIKARINKFQVEDLYIKREASLPNEIINEDQELPSQSQSSTQVAVLSNNQEIRKMQGPQLTGTTFQNIKQQSPIKLESSFITQQSGSSRTGGGVTAKTSSRAGDNRRRSRIVKMNTNQSRIDYSFDSQSSIQNMGQALINPSSDFNQFSYLQIKDEDELREIKVLQEKAFKLEQIEKMKKQDLLQKNIDQFKQQKRNREKQRQKQISPRQQTNRTSHDDALRTGQIISGVRLPMIKIQKIQSDLRIGKASKERQAKKGGGYRFASKGRMVDQATEVEGHDDTHTESTVRYMIGGQQQELLINEWAINGSSLTAMNRTLVDVINRQDSIGSKN